MTVHPRPLLTRGLARALAAFCITGLVLAGCGPTPTSPFPAKGREGLVPLASQGEPIGAVTRSAERLEPDSEPIAGLSPGDWAGIREQIERDRYRAERRADGGGSVYHAVNPAQRLRLDFGAEGASASPRGEASWSLELGLASWGYGSDQRAIGPVEPVAVENRVEYRRGVLTEWYVNEAQGVEQGFTLLEPPVADPGAGPLRLELAASGNLTARLADDGGAIVWRDETGRAVLRYGGLAAWDAGGRALPATLGLSPVGPWLEVDDRAAEYPLTIDPWLQQAELGPLGAADDQLGASVAVSGNTAVVGAPFAYVKGEKWQGAAYVFLRSGSTWTQQQRLTASDGVAEDRFGKSVAVIGNTALVGAPFADVGGDMDQGAAYVFVRSGTTWSEQQKLSQTAPDGTADDNFGASVALSGETALIGAPLAESGANQFQGAAYVFVRTGGTTWSQQQKLTLPGGAAGDQFGTSVALSGNAALVGAPYVDAPGKADQGAAYVFTGGSGWGEVQVLTPLAADSAAGDNFGQSVALSGETSALVGAPGADVGGNQDQGAAYVFLRNDTAAPAGPRGGGPGWFQHQKLAQAVGDGGAFDQFGASVALDAAIALVGAPSARVDAIAFQGAAYVFVRGGATWTEQQKLTQPPAGRAPFDAFGSSVALSGETALVGVPAADVAGSLTQGAAHVFVRSGTTWAHQQKLPVDDGEVGGRFGLSVALSGATALVGAPEADVGASVNQGAAYVFVRSGGTWAQQQKLTAPDGAPGDLFGTSVALDGSTALVGAPNGDAGMALNRGAAYVFVRGGGPWELQKKLNASDAALGDQFGYSVALEGETALVGAPFADVGGITELGKAYVFARNETTWTEQQKLLADDGAMDDQFGRSVALSGNTVLVGAPFVDVDGRLSQGAAYVFVRSGTTWTRQQKLTQAAGDGAAADLFGTAVALSGETALVGAPEAVVDGKAEQGAAYVFVRGGTTWAQQQKLTAADGAANDSFGQGVGLSSDTALVGAPSADLGGKPDQGAAYAFARGGTTWTQQGPRLLDADGAESDYFGYSVALDGDTTVVGGPFAPRAGAANHGAAYAFAFSPDPTATPTATVTPTIDPSVTATPTPTATIDPNVTPTATPTFVPCKTIKPKVKAKLRKGTRTVDLTIDPKSFARPCSFVRAVVDWGDATGEVTLTTPSAAHAYAGAGSFTLSVRLTDTGGHTVAAKPKKLKVK